jgi:hypothetical protein
MTFKNAVAIRTVMQKVKLFDHRDNILESLIRHTDKDSDLNEILNKFSLEIICNSPTFKESLALASLVSMLASSRDPT